jgi:hypothetical protein
MKNLKLQSAMEYLITYGWAILIIAIVIVIAFTFSQNSGNPLQTACTPLPGFACNSVTFLANRGASPAQATFIVGQNTGVNWPTVTIYYITEANSSSFTASGIPSQIYNKPNEVDAVIPGGLQSGQTAQVSIYSPPGITWGVGTVLTGTIWAEYTTSTNPSTTYYVEMARIIAKAA